MSPTSYRIYKEQAESQFSAHDIAIGTSLARSHDSVNEGRFVRFVLLSGQDLCDGESDSTLAKLKRFASLTGGNDIAICFLLGACDATDKTSGIAGYTALQHLLTKEVDIRKIPTLLCAPTEDVASTIKAHADSLLFKRPAPATARYLDLLSRCNNGPALNETQTNLTSDHFGSIPDLAYASLVLDKMHSQGRTTSMAAEEKETLMTFHSLREQIGNEAARNMYLFWKTSAGT
ncbi:hypothetical protein CAC42_5696 [Sphaceloma murrayae]|uniref:Uncharacterized protein n=1 Tax=Sphaceloma murrayae TaxID=2082308 RepID=A0A2K1QYW6_9PEZI|nr:hypothetical protein CAC42_5696 [Sphaceloma murrayae]